MAKKSEHKCAFCGRTTPFMLQGMDGVYICSDCVRLANQVVAQQENSLQEEAAAAELTDLPKPADRKSVV